MSQKRGDERGSGRGLMSYIWWTHERGSVHYDVMVTLILAVIFLTPRFWNYRDTPKPDYPAGQIRAQVDPAGGLIYEVPVSMVAAPNGLPADADLALAIGTVAGPVTVERKEPVKEIGGRVVAWKVWAEKQAIGNRQ
jgi:hypothetical protein